MHVNHWDRAAELKLRDELEQKRGGRLAAGMHLMLAGLTISAEVPVRRDTAEIEMFICLATSKRGEEGAAEGRR